MQCEITKLHKERRSQEQKVIKKVKTTKKTTVFVSRGDENVHKKIKIIDGQGKRRFI